MYETVGKFEIARLPNSSTNLHISISLNFSLCQKNFNKVSLLKWGQWEKLMIPLSRFKFTILKISWQTRIWPLAYRCMLTNHAVISITDWNRRCFKQFSRLQGGWQNVHENGWHRESYKPLSNEVIFFPNMDSAVSNSLRPKSRWYSEIGN